MANPLFADLIPTRIRHVNDNRRQATTSKTSGSTNGMRGRAMSRMSNNINNFLQGSSSSSSNGARQYNMPPSSSSVRQTYLLSHKTAAEAEHAAKTRQPTLTRKRPRRNGMRGRKTPAEIQVHNEDGRDYDSDEGEARFTQADFDIEVGDDEVEYMNSEEDEYPEEPVLRPRKKKKKQTRHRRKPTATSSSSSSSSSEDMFTEESSDEDVSRQYRRQRKHKTSSELIERAQRDGNEDVQEVDDDDDDDDDDKEEAATAATAASKRAQKTVVMSRSSSDDDDVDTLLKELSDSSSSSSDDDGDDASGMTGYDSDYVLPMCQDPAIFQHPHFPVVFARYCKRDLTHDQSRSELLQQLQTYCVHDPITAEQQFLEDHRGKMYHGRKLAKVSDCTILFEIIADHMRRLLVKYGSYMRYNRRTIDQPPDPAEYEGWLTDSEASDDEDGDNDDGDDDDEKRVIAPKVVGSYSSAMAPPKLSWGEIMNRARAPATKQHSVDDSITYVYELATGVIPQDNINFHMLTTWKRLVAQIQIPQPTIITQSQLVFLCDPSKGVSQCRTIAGCPDRVLERDTFYALVARLYRLAHPHNPALPKKL